MLLKGISKHVLNAFNTNTANVGRLSAIFSISDRYPLFNSFSHFSSSVVRQPDSDSKTLSEGLLTPTKIKKVLESCREKEKVRVQGWVKGFRKQKEYVFLDLNDGGSFHRLSVVLPSDKKPHDLNIHTSVDITGVLVPSLRNPAVLELHPTSDVIVLGSCDQKLYPFAGKVKYTPDYTRQYLHLRPKTNQFSAVLRLRNAVSRAIHDYFHQMDFLQIHTPIITSNDCEGAGETFTVQPESEELIRQMKKERSKEKHPVALIRDDDSHSVFFDKKVHLSVSSQLHLEAAASGVGNVWTFSPVFRAENQQSTRHLSEFYMVEAEVAFAYNLEDILNVMDSLVKFCIKNVLDKHGEDWNFITKEDAVLRETLARALDNTFTIMTYDEASRLLETKASSVVEKGNGLSREQELTLVEKLNNRIPVFVVDWPADTKPFYMRQCDYDLSKVSAVDLLVPSVGELCGGSLREYNVETLETRLGSIDPTGELRKSLGWYLEFRKFGKVPSGGFGLGFDRLMQYITGIHNIKDVSVFPRWAHNCPM